MLGSNSAELAPSSPPPLSTRKKLGSTGTNLLDVQQHTGSSLPRPSTLNSDKEQLATLSVQTTTSRHHVALVEKGRSSSEGDGRGGDVDGFSMEAQVGGSETQQFTTLPIPDPPLLQNNLVSLSRPPSDCRATQGFHKSTGGTSSTSFKYATPSSPELQRSPCEKRPQVPTWIRILSVHHGLDRIICESYERRCMNRLFNWQAECLSLPGVLQGTTNLVYCAPTSGGKTFVSELLMFRCVCRSRRSALLVLPYVSLVVEKQLHLQAVAEGTGIKVVAFHQGSRAGAEEEFDIGVCTIEKANSICNQLLEMHFAQPNGSVLNLGNESNREADSNLFTNIGVVVIDELHMMADPNRGYLLEILLTKLNYFVRFVAPKSGKAAQSLQIIGMSATLPNGAEVSRWLNAHYYCTEFRPVSLKEYYLHNQRLFEKPTAGRREAHSLKNLSRKKFTSSWLSRPVDFSVLRDTSESFTAAKTSSLETKCFIALCFESLIRGDSVLVFCATRRQTELVAAQLVRAAKKLVVGYSSDQESANARTAIISELMEKTVDVSSAGEVSVSGVEATGLDILREAIPEGIAFHHSGLSVEERLIVETGYRTGALKLLTATSTLAAGVNLPAARVLFHSPYIAKQFLDVVRYKQMSGRAGRTGQRGSCGESILICPANVSPSVLEGLITAPLPPLRSALTAQKQGLHRLILEVIATHFNERSDSECVWRSSDLIQLSYCTLLSAQKMDSRSEKCLEIHTGTTEHAKRNHADVYDAMQFLLNHGQVTYNSHKDWYECTKQGQAVVLCGLSPWEGYVVYSELENSTSPMFLQEPLYLLYLITPVSGGLCGTVVESRPENGVLTVSTNSDISAGLSYVDWSAYSDMVRKLSVSENLVLKMLRLNPSHVFAASKALRDGRSVLGTVFSGDRYIYFRYSRLFTTLAVSAIMHQFPLAQVSKRFSVTIGQLQALLTMIASDGGCSHA